MSLEFMYQSLEGQIVFHKTLAGKFVVVKDTEKTLILEDNNGHKITATPSQCLGGSQLH
jgi:hypothetical protein